LMRVRRRETADTLAVQMIELECERAALQERLYGVLKTDKGAAVDVRRGLDEAAQMTRRIGRLGGELRRAEERSLPVEDLI
jgi:hypothetical protein